MHCLVIMDFDTKAVTRYNNQEGGIPIELGLQRLVQADKIVAHNAIDFDAPVIEKLYPHIKFRKGQVVDTLVMARLLYPDTYDRDTSLVLKGKLDKALVKRHSLKAWGQRLGEHKADYDGGFESWNPDMEEYCVQDVITLDVIYAKFLAQQCTQDAIDLEHQVRIIISRQEQFGFNFNVAKAAELYVVLSKRKLILEEACKDTFKPFYLKDGAPKVSKVNRRDQVEEMGLDYNRPLFEGKGKAKVQIGHYFKTHDYVEGAAYTKVKLTEFNPGSRAHIENRLKRLFGWKPKEFTDNGQAKIDETILEGLVYPQAKVLQEYFMVDKRIAQLAEGKEAWLKHEKNGKVHCRINTMGAVTSRMTHSGPNLAQVPACTAPYGAECRELFGPPPGMIQIGADASGLELRGLAGYMAKWDGGKYIKTVCEGRNEDGTDIHTVNMRALGIDRRDIAKTFIYAFLYGAGDEKIGTTLYNVKGPKARRAGKDAKAKFTSAIPALGELIKAVKGRAKKNKYLIGLDGRRVPVRSDHAALNTLLQSAGAIIMKRALVILDERLQEKFVPGIDYEFMANVHDEFQIAAKPELAQEVGAMCVQAITDAGLYYKFKCPLTGEFKVGNNWKDTH